MKLKILAIAGILALALPAVSLAQTTGTTTGAASGSSSTTSTAGTTSTTSTAVPVPVPAPTPSTSCAMPVNPQSASDLLSVITCLQSRINNLEAKVAQLQSSGPTVVLPSSASSTAVSAVQGIKSSSEDTKAIQDFLKAEGSFTYPSVTGYYGPITTQAVKAFQEKEGLDATGEVDDSTLQRMQQLAPSVAPSASSALQQIQVQTQTQTQNSGQTQPQNQVQNQTQSQVQYKVPGSEGGDN